MSESPSAQDPGDAARIVPALPLRDIVVFPHMVVPLFVGREKSVRALEEVMRGDKQILLVTQKDRDEDDPTPEAHLRRRRARQRPAAAEAARRHRQGAGRGHARAPGAALHRTQAAFYEAEVAAIEETGGEAHEAEALSRAVIEQFENYVKLNKKVPPEALASIPQITEPGRAGRQHRRPPGGEDHRPPAAAGDRQRREAAGEGLRPDGRRDQRAAGREEDPQPRQAADGEDPARVLPERTDEGDPARAGRAGRRARRADRARKAHQEDQALQGGPRPRPRAS